MPEKELNSNLRMIPSTFEDNTSDPVVSTMLDTVQDAQTAYNDEYTQLETINDLALDSYDIHGNEPNPTLLSQVIDLLEAKTKPLDTQIQNNQAGASVNYNVSKALGEIMEDGGFVEMLKGGKGGFFKKYLFGDFIGLTRANPTSGLPEYMEGTLKGFYPNVQGTKFLTKSGTKITRLMLVYEYDWDNAVSQFPGLEDVASSGRLPITNRSLTDNVDYTDEQDMMREKRLVEIGIGFDISDIDNPVAVTIAGPGASIVPDTKLEGADYEWNFGKIGKTTNEPYIPVLHFMCKPYGRGFFNKGFGHLLYKYTKILQKMQTKFIRYTDKNFDPTRVYNLPYKKGGNLAKQLADADILRANGKPPVVVHNYTGSGDLSPVRIDTLETRQMDADYERLKQDINQEVRRYGINVDIFFNEAGKLATAIVSEDVNQNLAIQQLQEANTGTYRQAVKFAMDIFKKNVSKNDKTVFKFQPKAITTEGIELDIERPMTYGDMKQLLDKFDFNVLVNSRTGSYPSPLFMNRLRTQAINGLMATGDTGQAQELMVDLYSDFGLNIRGGQAAPQGGGGGQAPELEALVSGGPTQTKDLLI